MCHPPFCDSPNHCRFYDKDRFADRLFSVSLSEERNRALSRRFVFKIKKNKWTYALAGITDRIINSILRR